MTVIPGGQVLTLEGLRIGVLGGTGPQGKGLGLRFAIAGHSVVLGSRDAERAAAAAEETRALRPELTLDVRGGTNDEAATHGDIVVLAVPYDGHAATLQAVAPLLDGKIVVDCVNPMAFDKRGAVPVDVREGSAAEQTASLVPGARVVSAFHDVSARRLFGTNSSVNTDVLVCGDDVEAKTLVVGLATQVPGMRGIDAGPLRLSRELESLTTVLLAINKRYKTHAGVRITGV
ncbi:MAG TPA: NADPH-dependent F420 reductase [Mycobacteriales bacterium]|nr:NADPH-dependent F420 reductase [Mycobacteriales bacterium]